MTPNILDMTYTYPSLFGPTRQRYRPIHGVYVVATLQARYAMTRGKYTEKKYFVKEGTETHER